MSQNSPQPWQRFVAGTASGVVLVLVGHPLDTVRVRMQLGEGSFARAVSLVYRSGGLRGFYAGMAPPLLMTGAINTVLWGTTFTFMDALEARGLGGGPTQRAVLAAVPCGAAIALLVTPVEGIKSRMQARAGSGATVADTVRSVLATDGVRGLYRGASACALARASNWAYFGASAAVLEALGPSEPGWPSMRNSLLSGAGAGVCYWLAALPFDTCKARMMAAADGLRPRPTLRSTAAAVFADGGLRAFYRGLAPALLRAVPTNAATFLVFDRVMRAMQGMA